jgi:hypothetical protein
MLRSTLPKCFFTALIVVAVSGCATQFDRALKDSRQKQVLSRIDACLKQQQETNRKLSLQLEQISDQQEQLGELNQKILAQADANTASTSASAKDFASCNEPDHIQSNKLLVGSMEEIWLPDIGLALLARVDTGAETASLDARNIEIFERNGRRWVRFEILNPKTNKVIPLERKLKRTVLILQASTTDAERRPVVKMSVTVGDINQTAEFTLSNRAHLDHQALIGRNILQDVMIVDVSQKNIAPLLKETATDSGKRR